MQHFHVIEDGTAILRAKRGVYRQEKIYHRGRDVFARMGGGFVRLLGRSGTTDPNVSWLEVEGPGVTIEATGGGVPRFAEVADEGAQKAA